MLNLTNLWVFGRLWVIIKGVNKLRKGLGERNMLDNRETNKKVLKEKEAKEDKFVKKPPYDVQIC